MRKNEITALIILLIRENQTIYIIQKACTSHTKKII